MERLLQQLVDKLRKGVGEDLVSVILYGSAVDPREHDPDYSDINVLCVLREVTPRQLAAAQSVFSWWRTYDKPLPLLLSEKEVNTSTDCFAIEFHDLLVRRRVLAGRDAIADLHVDDASYRTQVEYELRSKLLRLRQKAASVLGDRKLLSRLLVESITTFCILIRHALLLHGVDAPYNRRAVLDLARQRFAIEPASLIQLLDVREKKRKAGQISPETLLGDYLKQIEAVIDAVDKLETQARAAFKGDL